MYVVSIEKQKKGLTRESEKATPFKIKMSMLEMHSSCWTVFRTWVGVFVMVEQ